MIYLKCQKKKKTVNQELKSSKTNLGNERELNTDCTFYKRQDYGNRMKASVCQDQEIWGED